MEGAALFIGIFGLMAVGAWLKAKGDMAEKDRLFEAQKLILDKLGSGEEVRRFLDSEQGREFFERLKSPAKTPEEQDTYGQNAYGMFVGGVITLAVGIALVVGAIVAELPQLHIGAAICIAVGIGLFITAAVSDRLAKKEEKGRSTGAGARAS